MELLYPEGTFVRLDEDSEYTRFGTLVHLAPGWYGIQQRPGGRVEAIASGSARIQAWARRRVRVFYTESCMCEWGPCGPGWRWCSERDGWGGRDEWRERLYATHSEPLAAGLEWLRTEYAALTAA
ncbi:hypothetical protein [Kitasatospora cinereorecta]|uniref:Uncharacterized protein n=1 Tax=Kitasatospora cinereorecta TaxID=285560 RepID=A0ABW0V8P8_9ACTN